MGLDMFLYADGYISNYEWVDQDVRERHAAVAKALGIADVKNVEDIKVRVTVGYWRKANAVHAWFVKHVQDGKDECQVSYVTRDKLCALRDSCNAVLLARGTSQEAEIILKELPPTSGFFFGSTAIDDWYFNDISKTVEIIDNVLINPVFDKYQFHYCSSW